MTNFPRRSLVAFPVALLAGCLFGGGGGSSADPADPGLPPAGESPPVVEPPPAAPRPMVAYVSSLGTATLTAFDVDPVTGDLTQIGAPVLTGGNPMQVVVDPSGSFACVAAYDDTSVISYLLDPASHLPVFASQSVPDYRVRSVAVHPSGKFVYGTDELNDRIAMFTVDGTTGVLTATTPATADTGVAPHFITVHPNGQFAYVAHAGEDTIGVYSIDQTTGVLTEIPANRFVLPATAANPFIFAVDPKGEFAYLASSGAGSQNVSAFAIDSGTGALTLLGTPLSLGGQNPRGIAIHPSGRFVYVTASSNNIVSAYAMDNNVLTFVGSVAAGDQPLSVAVDLSGKFAYVTNEIGDTISIFTIDETTGALAARGAPFSLPAGFAPEAITIVEKK